MSRFDLSKVLSLGPALVHIGGEVRAPGWININPRPGPAIDIRGDHRRLALFPQSSVATIYASHVLEHLKPAEFDGALASFLRVLVPGGVLMASVPDMMVLTRIYCDPATSAQDRFVAMRMMFGGHIDEFDVHHAGFDEAALCDVLLGAGFKQATRVESFGVFDDMSNITLRGRPISLNVIAQK